MPICRLRGRVVDKLTSQPIPGVVVSLRKRESSGWSPSYTQITVDADGEFDYPLNLLGVSGSMQCELFIDKDTGYRYKSHMFSVSTYEPSKDLGEITLEPYQGISPDA